jgi:hypothetical protein
MVARQKQSLSDIEKRMRDRVNAAYKEIGDDEAPAAKRLTAFDRHGLKYAAIHGLNGLFFGKVCMQIYIKLEDEGKECTYAARVMMGSAIHSMALSSELDPAQRGQAARFFMHVVRTTFALVKKEITKEKYREAVLGHLGTANDIAGKKRRKMGAFDETELGDIKKSVEEDFFSKIAR